MAISSFCPWLKRMGRYFSGGPRRAHQPARRNCLLRLEEFEPRCLLAVFSVTSPLDAGAGSLRQAILNANATPGPDSIRFNIAPAGVHVISPTSALPTITDPVSIDGTTQLGFAGSPLIVLNGISAGNAAGVRITAGNCTVKGLVIHRFGREGIELVTNGGNKIAGNFIGTDVTGAVSAENRGGVIIREGSSNNTIGGTAEADRNLISGNREVGVAIGGSLTTGNLVQGNFIGTDVTGTAPLGNFNGVSIFDGANNNTIGGTAAGAGNLISGNNFHGVEIGIGIGTSGNRVEGNFIGTDVTGTLALGNIRGVNLVGGASNNAIGGTAPGAGNLISGNAVGVRLRDLGTTVNRVEGNFIGTDVSGTVPLGNFEGIVFELDASNNTIGGTVPGAGNLVSGNARDGIRISLSRGNSVRGNFIGTDVSGAAPLSNGGSGVLINSGSGDNTIGGTASGAGNIIAFNAQGVRVGANRTDFSLRNVIRGNAIHSNLGLGIDLASDGVTPNDPGDADTGPNDLQNFPLLTLAQSRGDGTRIAGTLHSQPNTMYTLDLFANTVAETSGHGEGERYLGSLTLITDASGNATFDRILSAETTTGEFITATATAARGSTSEFSAARLTVLTGSDTGTGDDLLSTAAGIDYLFAGIGNGSLIEFVGRAYLCGQGGDDRIYGDDGLFGDTDDMLYGGEGLLSGDAGRDQLYAENGDDTLNGGDDGIADVLVGELLRAGRRFASPHVKVITKS